MSDYTRFILDNAEDGFRKLERAPNTWGIDGRLAWLIRVVGWILKYLVEQRKEMDVFNDRLSGVPLTTPTTDDDL